MKNLSRPKRVLLWIACACVIIGAVSLVFNTLSQRWRHKADYNEYRNDFQTIADLVLTEYEDARYDKNERMEFLIGRNGNDYYISNNGVILKLSDSEQKSMNNVIKAFEYEYSYPSEIDVRRNRVSFHITAGQYALVYSEDGSEPDYLNKPTEDTKIHVRSIDGKWYHVAAD